MQAFVSHPQVMAVIARGETKSSVEFDNNLRAQLWVHPPERFGTALQYATGSKDHNVRLRELALKKGSRSPTRPSSKRTARSCSSPTRKGFTPPWACPGSRPSCARTTAKWKPPWQDACRA